MKKWIFLLLFLPLICFAKSTLFILFDTGETQALIPVIEALRSRGEHVDVLTFGISQSLGVPNAASIASVGPNWDRDEPISDKQMTGIMGRFNPDLVILGASSRLQIQLALAYQGSVPTMAYYDSFDPIDKCVFEPLIREMEEVADLFLVPSDVIADSSNAKLIHVVGNPDIQQLRIDIDRIDTHQVYKKMGLDESIPIVAYFGGYDPDYEHAFAFFATLMKPVPNYQVLLCPHPKTNGGIERKYYGEAIFSKGILTTTEVLAIATVVICHRSSIGVKALFAGKKVIFFDPGDYDSHRYGIVTECAADFYEALEASSFRGNSEGLPLDSLGWFLALILDEKS